MTTRLGLDLRGGLQVLLEADLPEDVEVDAEFDGNGAHHYGEPHQRPGRERERAPDRR